MTSSKRPNKSVLDEIIATQNDQNLQEVDPERIILKLIKKLPERTQEIIKKRFGLTDSKKETLEEIGKSYGITRERVRQIESSTVNELRTSDRLKTLDPVERAIEILVEEYGRIMEHNHLIDTFTERLNKEANKNIIEFILELSNRFERHDESDETNKAWSLKEFNPEVPKQVIAAFKEIFESNGEPINHSELENYFTKHKEKIDTDNELNSKVLGSYLQISKTVLKNPFDEWGLVHWSVIIPKGVKDKAYLVLKKNEKPLHFTDITDHINKSDFDYRKAVPQTVHNELIKDQRFVLVGRGIYALTEWGYKEGTVADIISEILKKAGQPMTRDEIINEVLKQRIVKRNTIILALQDKDKFKRVAKQKFSIGE